MTQRQRDKIVRHIRRHLLALERGKGSFDIATRHLEWARKLGAVPGEPIDLGDGIRVRLVDNYADEEQKGVTYRPARFPRFEIKPVRRSGVSPDVVEEVGAA